MLLTCSTCFHVFLYFRLTMFIVLHLRTKTNSLYVEACLAIKVILTQIPISLSCALC